MKMQVWRPWVLLLVAALLAAGLGCEAVPSGPRAWVDFPLNGSSVPVGTPVAVIAHAYAPDGVAEVLLSVNEEPYRRRAPTKPGSTFSDASLDWFPQQEGDYVLQVKAYAKNGEASSPAAIRVRAIGKVAPTPPPPFTTPTLVPVLDLAIDTVEPIVIGYKGDVAICDIRLVYRNAGSVQIPADYEIQAHLNGTPFMSITRGAGFPPGGVSEAIFHYQFVDSAYIGINLDSTNTLAESDESNNAFAEARLCGGPTPVRPTTPAPPISITPTTPTLTPTATPTRVTPVPPPPAGCSGTPNISSFSAAPSTIVQGQSATLSWGSVSNADAVSIDQGVGGVGTPGSTTVSPARTTTYTLTARCGSNATTREVTVHVNTPVPPTHTPTPTRTPTPRDTQGPPAPGIVGPKGNLTQCVSNVTLDWNAVSDASGIKNYIVKWVRDGSQTGGATPTGTQHSISVSCDSKSHTYTWSVQAVDNAGNPGGTSSASFTVPAELH